MVPVAGPPRDGRCRGGGRGAGENPPPAVPHSGRTAGSLAVSAPHEPDLSPRERRFAEEYALRENGAEAARRAGFSYRSARQLASRMLARDDILAAVEDERARLAKQLRVGREELAAELAHMAFANMLDYTALDDEGGLRTDLSNVNRAQAAAIHSIETEQIADPETGSLRLAR